MVENKFKNKFRCPRCRKIFDDKKGRMSKYKRVDFMQCLPCAKESEEYYKKLKQKNKKKQQENKYLVAVRINNKNTIFSFKLKKNRDDFIKELKKKKVKYATSTRK